MLLPQTIYKDIKLYGLTSKIIFNEYIEQNYIGIFRKQVMLLDKVFISHITFVANFLYNKTENRTKVVHTNII